MVGDLSVGRGHIRGFKDAEISASVSSKNLHAADTQSGLDTKILSSAKDAWMWPEKRSSSMALSLLDCGSMKRRVGTRRVAAINAV